MQRPPPCSLALPPSPPPCRETLTYLYNTIQANWCANMESISPQQMINEAGNYWNQYSGRKLRLAA